MKRNNKLVILIALVTTAIIVWMPKGKKGNDTSLPALSTSFNQALPMIHMLPRKRTEFVGWSKDPFAKPPIEKVVKKTGNVSNLKLTAIIWDNKKASVFINNSILSVGDKITDKTVKQIEQNKVILTDGTKDYVLELQE